MLSNTKELMIAHSIPDIAIARFEDMKELILFNEYETGFVSLIKTEEYDFLFSAENNNKYTTSMWRDIYKILKNRTRPVMVSYGDNIDRLIKASKKYGPYEKIQDNIIIFL